MNFERIFLRLMPKCVQRRMSDELYLKLRYKAHIGRKLNLDEPKTFNGKLQWLKLYDRKDEYTYMVDKYHVKEYVAQKIGEQYVISTIGVWDTPDDIIYDELPNQFVLKCTHDSGACFVCTDKSSFDYDQACKKIKKCLNRNYFWLGREWPYKNVKPQVICEELLVDSQQVRLIDYKFMCFNGKVKCVFTVTNRELGKKMNVTFYDETWNKMPFERQYKAGKAGPKPHNFDKMIQLAEILAENIPFVRVDFYEVNRKIYFGELTFYPGGGMERFSPEKWDEILGGWLDLPRDLKK